MALEYRRVAINDGTKSYYIGWLRRKLTELRTAQTLLERTLTERQKREDEMRAALEAEFGARIAALTRRRDGVSNEIAVEVMADDAAMMRECGPSSRTIKLDEGTITLRTTTGKVVIYDEGMAIARLRQLKLLMKFTRTTISLDIAALKKAPQILAKLPGVRLEESEVLRIRPTESPEAETIRLAPSHRLPRPSGS